MAQGQQPAHDGEVAVANYSTLLASVGGVQYAQHAVLTFSGTGAAPGIGYPSWVVAGADQDRVYEVPIDAPWSFGPIPVAGATDPMAPSYADSVQIAVGNATGWINANPLQTFAIGGYSQGAEAASRVLAEIMSGSLQWARPNLIGGYTFGNPWRCKGKGIFTLGRGDVGKRGIGTTNLTPDQVPDTWHDHVGWWGGVDDMYTATPDDEAGVDISAVYAAAIQVGLSMGAIHNLITAVLTGQGALAQQIIKLLTNPLLEGPALIEAIATAIGFVACQPPTGPHITYEFSLVDDGTNRTHIQHAVDHLNTIAAAMPARAAA